MSQLEEEPELRSQVLLYRNGDRMMGADIPTSDEVAYQTEDEDEEDIAALRVPDSELLPSDQFAGVASSEESE